MWLLVAGSGLFVAFGGWALLRARRELAERGRLGVKTFLAAFLAYVGHAAVTLFAAWKSTWTVPIDPRVALSTGSLMVVVGASLYMAARIEFRTFRRTWGLDNDRLVTTGIYRFSRNPQTLGAVLFLAGASLAGRSAVAVLLVTLLWVASLIWLPVEEKVLEHLFGDKYRRYRDTVPRYLGLPGNRSRGDNAAS